MQEPLSEFPEPLDWFAEPTPPAVKAVRHRKAYSQKRAAFGVWAVTIDKAERRQAIAWKNSIDPETTERYAQAVAAIVRDWSPVMPAGAVVTCPPQGASFPGEHAAEILARRVADILAIPFARILERTDEKTGHHPAESLRQAPFQAAGELPPIALVVDDLITSGTTMRLSLEAIRQAGACAFGFTYAGA